MEPWLDTTLLTALLQEGNLEELCECAISHPDIALEYFLQCAVAQVPLRSGEQCLCRSLQCITRCFRCYSSLQSKMVPKSLYPNVMALLVTLKNTPHLTMEELHSKIEATKALVFVLPHDCCSKYGWAIALPVLLGGVTDIETVANALCVLAYCYSSVRVGPDAESTLARLLEGATRVNSRPPVVPRALEVEQIAATRPAVVVTDCLRHIFAYVLDEDLTRKVAFLSKRTFWGIVYDTPNLYDRARWRKGSVAVWAPMLTLVNLFGGKADVASLLFHPDVQIIQRAVESVLILLVSCRSARDTLLSPEVPARLVHLLLSEVRDVTLILCIGQILLEVYQWAPKNATLGASLNSAGAGHAVVFVLREFAFDISHAGIRIRTLLLRVVYYLLTACGVSSQPAHTAGPLLTYVNESHWRGSFTSLPRDEEGGPGLLLYTFPAEELLRIESRVVKSHEEEISWWSTVRRSLEGLRVNASKTDS